MRTQSIKILDPENYFSDWHYRIDKHHYETLGVVLNTFVKNKILFKSYAIQSPPNYQFHQGYIFYDGTTLGRYLQIAAEIDAYTIEVHEGHTPPSEGKTTGYAVSTDDFAKWLRNGQLPTHHRIVDTPSSKAGLLGWRLNQS